MVVGGEPRTSQALALGGFDVVVAHDVTDAVRIAGSHRPDAIVLDTGGAGDSGLAVCRALRELGLSTPILALGESSAVSRRVAVLEAGADDYVIKPFVVDELLARVRALLRRSRSAPEVVGVADLTLDAAAHEVRRGKRDLELTPIEFRLLELLMRNAGRVVDRSAIFEHVWGFDFGPSSNLLNVYVGYLRRKTEAGGASRLIHTVRGIGYVVRAAPQDS